MADLSTDELTKDGEHGLCETCGESFHWEQLTNLEAGAFCGEHVAHAVAMERFGANFLGNLDEFADYLHDSAVDRGLGEGIGR